MSEGFIRSASYTNEWYTPKFIIDSLGEFDLDPCAPSVPLFKTAEVMYNEFDDGLAQKWEGRVWLNPPYSRPLITKFMRRMTEHNRGTALIFPGLIRNYSKRKCSAKRPPLSSSRAGSSF